ncbi:unnamed protein product [Cylicocyclus nassatus]|uniref:Schlafen AlbA-2 domain-containing protein n=1 Tax=Cylicocyclus nassatus TaxID=53992 RepID=A0AA36MH92_CYLNA|nr:unnamed protein product [Cylicocyclus nassatus]
MGHGRIRRGEQCTLDEDVHTEFKMHTMNSLFEIPPYYQAFINGRPVRKQPISKTISAFLNTEGGTIYAGIDDQAVIRGIEMTAPMKDHFILSLNHSLSQFTPPVPPELVQVQFLEIDDPGNNENAEVPSPAEMPTAYDALNGNEDNSEAEFQRPVTKEDPRAHHVLGEACFCDFDYHEYKLYLIVIEVHKSTNGTIYQNEEGLAYRRNNCVNQMMTISDLNTFTQTDLIEETGGWLDWLRKLPLLHLLCWVQKHFREDVNNG